jgi:lipopolysaccharide/colanic/teichoic acid biosynthesis glycosyltransferase
VLVAAFLVASSPIILFLFCAILATGHAPVFRQERVGYLGKTFTIFKFRTIPDGGWEHAEAVSSPMERRRLEAFRLQSRLMRPTGLDEIPQMINILRGDMRLIGPRPLTPQDHAELPEPRHLRCAVPPGLTGLAQINGGQDLDPVSKLALDLYLLENIRPRICVEIVFRSVCRVAGLTRVVARPRGRHLELAIVRLAQKSDAALGAPGNRLT